MANKASLAAYKAKAVQVVAVKDGRIEVTDQAEASRQKVKTLPAWLTQGPDVAAAHLEKELSGLSAEAKAAIKELATAVAALRDLVESLY
ncbi:MAG: hypothetical protein ABIK12_03365 [Pseudomonadota bacterium]